MQTFCWVPISRERLVWDASRDEIFYSGALYEIKEVIRAQRATSSEFIVETALILTRNRKPRIFSSEGIFGSHRISNVSGREFSS